LFTREFKFDYPLSGHSVTMQEALQRRSRDMRTALDQEIRGILDRQSDEGAYIDSVTGRFSIKLPEFDFGNINKSEAYEEKPSSNFVGEHILRKAWIVTFGFPYKGQIEFLQYIPRVGSDLSTPQFSFDSQYMYFIAWTWDKLDKDVQKIKVEKENAIAFLQKRLLDATPELEQFNQALAGDVQAVFESLKQKYQKDKDALAQL